MGAAQLSGRALGHPCAIISFAVRLISMLSGHALSRAQRRPPCSSNWNAIVPCSLVYSAVVHVHLVAMLSRHAHSCAHCRRTCPSSRNAIAPCSLVCAASSSMPISPQRQRDMPNCVRNVIIHAHFTATPVRRAQLHAQRGGLTIRVAQQPHVADAATRRARSELF